jgi:hypothetical protein
MPQQVRPRHEAQSPEDTQLSDITGNVKGHFEEVQMGKKPLQPLTTGGGPEKLDGIQRAYVELSAVLLEESSIRCPSLSF